MASKLVPSNPSDVMVIRDVTPNVVTFSVPFLRVGKIPIGGRGTLGMSLLRYLSNSPLNNILTASFRKSKTHLRLTGDFFPGGSHP